jgi:hypothetical protein
VIRSNALSLRFSGERRPSTLGEATSKTWVWTTKRMIMTVESGGWRRSFVLPLVSWAIFFRCRYIDQLRNWAHRISPGVGSVRTDVTKINRCDRYIAKTVHQYERLNRRLLEIKPEIWISMPGWATSPETNKIKLEKEYFNFIECWLDIMGK